MLQPMSKPMSKPQEKDRKNRKYPWDKIPKGKSIVIKSLSPKVINSAINAAYGYGERTGKVFTIRRTKEEKQGENEAEGAVIHKVRILRLE